uniref:Pentatricopeptide repeat-containing protein At2g34400 n=1 Tax=Rhizophora mucronata TaxID=61149 RepID=A0A2P2NMT1_RHIMU
MIHMTIRMQTNLKHHTMTHPPVIQFQHVRKRHEQKRVSKIIRSNTQKLHSIIELNG